MLKTVVQSTLSQAVCPAPISGAAAPTPHCDDGTPASRGVDFEMAATSVADAPAARGLQPPRCGTVSIKNAPAVPQISQLCRAQAAVEALGVTDYLTQQLSLEVDEYRTLLSSEECHAVQDRVMGVVQASDPELQAAQDLAELPATILEPMTRFASTAAGKTLFHQLPQLNASGWTPSEPFDVSPSRTHQQKVADLAVMAGMVQPEAADQISLAWSHCISEQRADAVLQWLRQADGEAYLRASVGVMVGGVPRSTFKLAHHLKLWVWADASQRGLGRLLDQTTTVQDIL